MGLLLGRFIQNKKCMSFKVYRGVMCHGNEEWCEIWRGIDLLVQNWFEEFDEFWPEHSKISKVCPLMGCFWPKYIMLELKKYRRVMFDGTEYWCKIWRKTDLCFQSKMTWRIWQIFVHRLKSRNFSSESKKAELNQNKNSKQPDWPDAAWKLYFTFEINE